MARNPWFSGTLSYQMSVVTQAKNKIDVYATTLGLSPAQVTAFKAACDEILAAYAYCESSRASMQATTQWRDQVFYGQPRGSAAPPSPEFEALPDITFHNGVIDTFINFREQIVANPNYTLSMGEDMKIVGAEVTPVPPSEVEPNIKATASSEPSLAGTDSLVITGSMQTANAMKLYWTPKGGVTREVATVTSMPATIVITKSDPNEPESGTLQAQYYKKNQPYGNMSRSYNVTLA